MATELCPAIRARVHTSQPDAPRRVRKVWRRLYSTNLRTFETLSALACCFFKLDGSTWPLLVGAGHTQPSRGLPAASQRTPNSFLTLGVMGSTRRAAAVLPCVTNSVPWRPLTQVTYSHCMR